RAIASSCRARLCCVSSAPSWVCPRFRKLRAAAVRSAAIVEIVPSAVSVANGIKIAPSAHPVPSVSVRPLRTPSPWRAEPTLTTTRKKRASRSTMMRSWRRARRAKRAKRLCLQPRVLPHLRAVTVLPPDNSVAAAVVADVAVVPVVPLVAHLRAAVTAKPCSHPETSSGPHFVRPCYFFCLADRRGPVAFRACILVQPRKGDELCRQHHDQPGISGGRSRSSVFCVAA